MTLNEQIKEQMQNPEFAREWKRITPEHEIVRQIIEARAEQNLTQKQLADRIGMKQSNISRLESGEYNPSLDFLKKVAAGLGKELHIEFR